MTNPSVVSSEHLDYLQQIDQKTRGLNLGNKFIQPVKGTNLFWHISRVGRLKKRIINQATDKVRLPSQDVLTAMYGHKIPIAYLIHGSQRGTDIHWGTWQASGSPLANTKNSRGSQHILQVALTSLFGEVMTAAVPPKLPSLPLVGLATGTPSPALPDSVDGAVQMDRLIRAMAGSRWAAFVLAMPIGENETSKLRHNVIEEMRRVQQSLETKRVSAPLAKHYLDLLTIELQNLTTGLAVGNWRAGVYLLGDEHSYPRLSGLWCGIFSGEQSLPKTLQVVDGAKPLLEIASRWALPDNEAKTGPGYFKHPWSYQTGLNSNQLAVYTEFPQIETSGFAIDLLPDFDAVPRQVTDEAGVALGQVVVRGQPAEQNYLISQSDLTRHTFVSGVTGAGKTNTIFHLLKAVALDKVPFLVIEPAKKEYRGLIHIPELSSELRIFTLGNENIVPFRLNPFEVLPDTPVAVHLDLLRSVFAASFGMWTPLPQVLESCLHEIYRDRGWDIASNRNTRLNDKSSIAMAYPTLSDLAAKIDEVTKSLGYEDRVTADLRAALLTRINSLRTGAKGRMLDVQQSVPMETLLEKPTILELEGIGDDDDKAFVMGLLLIRLVSYRRSKAQSNELQHLLVIEEAHRLLTNVATQARAEEANPRGKAVETFSNLLSEIRAYGQGVIIADQVPVKLAPDVIKNTNLKIAHRIVAADDRTVLAGAMAMNEQQSHSLAIFKRGQAAIFSEGDDAPVLVQVPLVKPDHPTPTDEQVEQHMQKQTDLLATISSMSSFCDEKCHMFPQLCDLARRVVEDAGFQRTFARIVLSAIEDPTALDRLWPDLLGLIQPWRPPWADGATLMECIAAHAASWFAQRRGAQNGWSYAGTEQFAKILKYALHARVKDENDKDVLVALQKRAFHLHQRTFDPFPACKRICRQEPPLCLYRQAAADLLDTGRFTQAWLAAEELDITNKTKGKPQTWEVCADAGYELIEFLNRGDERLDWEKNHAAARRASLCFGQQMLANDPAKIPATTARFMEQLIKEAGHE